MFNKDAQIITLSLEPDSPAQKMAAAIRNSEAHCVTISVVAECAEGEGSVLTHTVGMSDLDLPELVVVGLLPESAVPMLTGVAKRIWDGIATVEVGKTLEDDRGDTVRVGAVSATAISEFLQNALGYRLLRGGTEIEAVQLILHDPEGLWPEDAECNPLIRKAQMLLDNYQG